MAAAGLTNLARPLELDVDTASELPACDVVYSANTLHIMSWRSGQRFLHLAGQALVPGGRLVIYGPFNVGGQATSDSNASFDAGLRARDAAMGVRDREAVCRVADRAGLSLTHALSMPANNQMLVFGRRREAAAR